MQMAIPDRTTVFRREFRDCTGLNMDPEIPSVVIQIVLVVGMVMLFVLCHAASFTRIVTIGTQPLTAVRPLLDLGQSMRSRCPVSVSPYHARRSTSAGGTPRVIASAASASTASTASTSHSTGDAPRLPC